MMGCSCMKVANEHNPYLHDREKYYCTRHSGAPPTRKSAKSAKKITNKETTVDLIRYLVVMKLARSVFAHKNQFYSPRTRIAPSIAMKYRQLRSAHGHSFVYVVE